MKFLFLISLFIVADLSIAQSISDSATTTNSFSKNIELQKSNSLKTDWTIINSPFMFFPTNRLYSQSYSSHSLYTDFQMNNATNFALQPTAMLNQFQLASNWESKKKYGVFAKYLGIAQFMGVVGLAAVHISKFHAPPKGKTNLEKNKFVKP